MYSWEVGGGGELHCVGATVEFPVLVQIVLSLWAVNVSGPRSVMNPKIMWFFSSPIKSWRYLVLENDGGDFVFAGT